MDVPSDSYCSVVLKQFDKTEISGVNSRCYRYCLLSATAILKVALKDDAYTL